MSRLVTRPVLRDFLHRLAPHAQAEIAVYLIGESSQVFESWRSWTAQIELAAPGAPPSFTAAMAGTAAEMNVRLINEFPGDLIPLPDGHEQRSRPALTVGCLAIRHFDPYATAFRFIARGDEPDYHLVLAYVRHGWIDLDEMNERLEALLPRFSMETIQQDPAEFRRKYKGMMQMARSIEPGTVHRHTPV